MSDVIVAHSHSAMNTYELCPKKYFEEKIRKSVPWEESEASRYGKEVHKAFELYVDKGKELPFGMQHYGKYLDQFVKAPGLKLVEQKMAINKNFESTGYFDDDVWFRGQADLIIINGKTAVVVDYKTGKLSNNFDQLELMAATAFCLDKNIERIVATFFWTKNKATTVNAYTRQDAMDIWAKFMNKAKRLERAVINTEFPAKPNGLCKNYCGVKDCPYNGE